MTAPEGLASQSAPTLYEHVGGLHAVHRLVAAWYPTVLADPVLQPVFGEGRPEHIPHLAAFLAEVFGGPTTYTDKLGGFPALLRHHEGKRITEPQRARFVELFLAAADVAGWPADQRTREALRGYLDFGTEVAVQNSYAENTEQLHPCQEVPRWEW